MITTYFRPSIHGWPFGNSWRKSFLYDTVTLKMGFCGGMCWTALERFYGGIPILRDVGQPSEGDPLYDEIWNTQVDSVPAGTLGDMYEWQMSPDFSHRGNPLHSLGHRTQEAWPSVKSSLDASKPVTITLIASSSDASLKHLEDSHRVVAYAYSVGSQGDGAPSGAHSKVTIWIYDPNYPDKDSVKLTFYRGADDNDIRLRHSKGDEFHGFFKDDRVRSYDCSDATMVQIDKCEQTGISSATRADYDFKFSWRCRFIPYFNILVNGASWRYNRSSARSRYEPTDKDNKQCPSRTGSLTVNLNVLRDVFTVAVRLLRDDSYYESIEVDALPSFKCYPYIRSRTVGEQPCVSDYDIEDTDLFIKDPSDPNDPNPSDAEIEQVDTSEFRWVMHLPRGHIDTRGPRDDLTTAYVEAIESKRLGNVIVPILANFEERNLAAPTEKSGWVTIFRNGAAVGPPTSLGPLADQAQKIFDGFLDNPSDYDNDTWVKFDYVSRDSHNAAARGQALFFGKSVLFYQSTMRVSVFDPAKLARLEGIARELVERGLIGIAINPPRGWPGPRPGPLDPIKLVRKLRRQRQLQGMIDQAFQSTWGNRRIWRQIWYAQSELLKQTDKGRAIHIEGKAKKGKVLKATKELQEKQQRAVDALVLNIVVKKTIDRLRRDPNVINMLSSL